MGMSGSLQMLTMVLGVATLGMIGVIFWSWLQNRRQPVSRAHARALRRRTRDWDIGVPTKPWFMIINALGWGPGRRRRIWTKAQARVADEITIASAVDYYVTFMVEGNEVELIVPERVYINVEDGAEGTLIYQGEIFKHFMPQQAQNPPPPGPAFDPRQTPQL